MQEETETKSQKEKKLEREIYILRYQNDRLLKYLRANKIFYKKKLDHHAKYLNQLKKELEDTRTEKIIKERNNETVSN